MKFIVSFMCCLLTFNLWSNNIVESIIQNDSVYKGNVSHFNFVPAVFLGSSLLIASQDKEIRAQRNRFIPNFKYKYDDFVQYAPAAVAFGLKASGVKGRNNIKRSIITYTTSVVIMGILVNSIKYTAKVTRPDGSTRNSFPSGHTAMAFTNAAFLDREYGLVNPLYSIGGYGAASLTAVGRGFNNRHWASDILAGAGIGILSSQLAYFFVDKIYGNQGDNLSFLSQFESGENPSFLSISYGYSYLLGNKKAFGHRFFNNGGWEASIDGAYFLNKNIGVGTKFKLTSFDLKDNTMTKELSFKNNSKYSFESVGKMSFLIGPQYNGVITDQLSLNANAMIGYNIHTKGLVSSEYLSKEDKYTNGTKEPLGKYKLKNSLEFLTGLSLTYKVKETLGVSVFSDFTHTRSRFDLDDYDNHFEGNMLDKSFDLNYLTFGIRLKAYF